MIASRLLSCSAFLALVACGSGSANLSARASASATVGEDESAEPAADSERADLSTKEGGEASTEERPGPEAPPATAYDPKRVESAIDQTARSVDERGRLGLRLAIVEQGPDWPWYVALVNRGTEPVRAVFDLRTLSLEVHPPVAEPPADAKKPVRAAKPPKPTVCALPKDIVPTRESQQLEVVLEPGEGVVDAFDPRLYCLPTKGASPLVAGATVVARLGFPEKTKTVWVKGKAEKRVIEQSAPFIARLANRAEPQPPEPPSTKPTSTSEAAPEELAFERYAVKQIPAPSVQLGPEYAPKPGPTEPKQPLALRLQRGSDARTERDASVTVTLVNQSAKTQSVYFRRELVTFEVSGPTGFVSCQPGPDERSPDRQSFITLGRGRQFSATSRLIELCPKGALRTPGLYLVRARFDAVNSGEEFGLEAFNGRLLSEQLGLIRVRKGWGEMPGQRQPLRIRVGGGESHGATSSVTHE